VPIATFVLGLCGSGKSYVADQIKADIKFHEGFWAEKRRWHNIAAVRATLADGGDVVVTVIAFCTQRGRLAVLQALAGIPDLTVRWIWTENNLEKANENCQRRKGYGNAARQSEINRSLSAQFHPPDGAEHRPMWPFDPSSGPTQTQTA
jgi:hypothetical protein